MSMLHTLIHLNNLLTAFMAVILPANGLNVAYSSKPVVTLKKQIAKKNVNFGTSFLYQKQTYAFRLDAS